MISFFSRLKRRKGFTLTEMIVVTAIIGIIMASVVAFASPMRDSIKNTEAKADALTINEVLGNYVEHRLAYACKLDAFVGYTYENTVTEISTAYNGAGGTGGYKADATATNCTVRMFLAHFDDPDYPDDPHNPPEKGTMKFYDVKLTASGLPALSEVIKDENMVFTKDFFGDYQYFMTIDDDDLGKNTNSRTKKAYMNIRLESYNFGPDDASNLKGSMIQDYYKYIISKGSACDNPFEAAAIVSEKIGTENISFTLENIKAANSNVSGIKTNSSGDKQYYSNGAPMFETTASTAGVTMHKPALTGTFGNDLVILYTVKKY